MFGVVHYISSHMSIITSTGIHLQIHFLSELQDKSICCQRSVTLLQSANKIITCFSVNVNVISSILTKQILLLLNFN